MLRALALMVVLLAQPVAAQDAESVPSAVPDSEFWHSAVSPAYKLSLELRKEPLDLLFLVLGTSTSRQFGDLLARSDGLKIVIERIERVQRLAPRDPEISFFLAYANGHLADAESTNQEARNEALRWLLTTRSVAPTYEPESVAFEFGIAYTRLRRFSEAIAEYRRALAETLDERDTMTIEANLAEVLMLSGDLEQAVTHYREAARLAPLRGVSAALALWGLAIALDRAGNALEAREIAWKAYDLGGNSFDPLTDDGVFFEPACELFYYQALGHEARATYGGENERQAARESALESWTQFITEAAPDNPFRERAITHAHEIERQIQDDTHARSPRASRARN